jgi:hypothetical protein
LFPVSRCKGLPPGRPTNSPAGHPRTQRHGLFPEWLLPLCPLPVWPQSPRAY